MLPKIKNILPTENRELIIEYENGEKKIFDVSPYITGAWYGELADGRYYKSVYVLPNHSGIEWPNGQDIAPHELYENSISL